MPPGLPTSWKQWTGTEAARAGIDAGFEFIHIDPSQARKKAPDEETGATRE